MTDEDRAEFERQLQAWQRHADRNKKTITGWHWHNEERHLDVFMAGGEWKPFADAIADTPAPAPKAKPTRRRAVQIPLL
jgi:hypothetical protein